MAEHEFTSLEYTVLRTANTYDWMTATAASRTILMLNYSTSFNAVI
jgi:hypothetical protein